MAITGTKLFASGDVLTANDTNQYLMRGVKVYSSTAVRDAAYGGAGEPTLEEGETCYITATDELQIYDGSSWVKMGPPTDIPYASASGGSETAITADSVSYTLHTFNSSANLTVSTAGYLDILCVGGGGGTQTSFAGNTRAGGGGGGEIKLMYRFYAPAGTYGMVVGAGGASGGVFGGRSYVKFYLSDIEFNVAFGGGGGSGGSLGYVGYWHGGSGGGGGGYGGANAGGPAQGDNTRKGGTAVSDSSGGGGGGAAADGGNASGGTGGAGGAGLDISLFLGQSATTTYKAGGGGGQGLSVNGTSGAGTGSANTGGGGVGGNNAGWSGIVYVRSLG